MKINSINNTDNRRKKRILDFVLSFILLIFSPILIFVNKRHLLIIKDLLEVIFLRRTLVGYSHKDTKFKELPPLRRSILTVEDNIKNKQLDEQTIHRINLMYANNWSVKIDFDIVLKNLSKI